MESNKILIIDNYDSFTYNLVHLVNECGYDAEVWRNDKFELADADKFDRIILSPGPGIPSEAGLLLDTIKTYAATKSIFGVCLGQQAIAEAFGAKLFNLPEPLHGIATPIQVNTNDALFKNCPQTFKAGRYHSWVVQKDSLPDTFSIIASDGHGEIMAIRHKTYDLCAVQFHPESVLTEHGRQMMDNWINASPYQ